ncbi:MAG: hypothetical protein C4576_04155 [Desulfobacteraceae bacterium]|nr:MAG: hypothetical protein C4576_04155 [Desulfobacteraceae bacterium]
MGLWDTVENSTVSLFSGPHPVPSENEEVTPQQSIFSTRSWGKWHGFDFSWQHGIVHGETCPMAWETPAKRNMTEKARLVILKILEFILD